MRGCPELVEAGHVYLLDDFTFVQVTDVTASRVRFRTRTGAPWRCRLTARRGVRPNAFRRRVRAKVDPGFFPDFAGSAVPPSAEAMAALRASLHDMAVRRPFGLPASDPPP